MERTRRATLATLCSLAGAGCLGAANPGDTDEATTRTTTTTEGTTTETTETTVDVSVSDVAVSPAVVAYNSPDSVGVDGDRGTQVVVATVAAAESPSPDAGVFALEADGTRYGPAEGVGGMAGNLWDYGEPYGEADSGWVAFVVPKPLEAGRVALTRPGGEHTLSAAARERLARPPTTFEVEEFAAPAEVRPGEDATLTVTVANVGDADGTWVGALNRSGPSVAYTPETSASLAVPAGETATWTHTNTPDDRYTDEPEGTMEFRLRWRDSSRSRSVVVTDDPTG
jgi:hypothetical protein